MEWIVFIPLLVSFFLTLVLMPRWIRKAKEFGLSGKDINKYDKPVVAEGGGVVAIAGFIIGVLAYIAIITFLIKDGNDIKVQIFSIVSSILMLSFIGLIDGFLGWKKGLGRGFRVILAIFASIPLVVINAGDHLIDLPFFGGVNFGIIYPLIIIPIAIAGTASVYNFLAGFNGLEAGLGVIIITFLSLVAYVTGTPWLAIVGLIMVAALCALLIFNHYPAKVFPGDVITYPVGGFIAIMAILGNFEKIAMFVFIPFFIEMILKIRGKLVKQSFGIPNKDGSIAMPYDKIYGLTHFSIWFLKKFKNKVYERDVTYFIFIIEILFCLAAIGLFLIG